VAKDGRGVALGFSADCASDPRSQAQPAAAYTGLRVVVGAPPQKSAK